jgi:hypothetical protein
MRNAWRHDPSVAFANPSFAVTPGSGMWALMEFLSIAGEKTVNGISDLVGNRAITEYRRGIERLRSPGFW